MQRWAYVTHWAISSAAWGGIFFKLRSWPAVQTNFTLFHVSSPVGRHGDMPGSHSERAHICLGRSLPAASRPAFPMWVSALMDDCTIVGVEGLAERALTTVHENHRTVWIIYACHIHPAVWRLKQTCYRTGPRWDVFIQTRGWMIAVVACRSLCSTAACPLSLYFKEGSVCALPWHRHGDLGLVVFCQHNSSLLPRSDPNPHKHVWLCSSSPLWEAWMSEHKRGLDLKGQKARHRGCYFLFPRSLQHSLRW